MIYCWNSGLLVANKIPSLEVVDGIIDKAEESLLRRMHMDKKSQTSILHEQEVHEAVHEAVQEAVKSTISEDHKSEEVSVLKQKEIENKVKETSHEANPPLGEGELHVVFSTDCTAFQDWQTLTVFYSAKAVGQKGPITRIASGCDPEKKVILTNLYKQLYPNYHIHYTPDFKIDEKTKKKYDFYNKPYGVQHFLDHASPPVLPGTVIAIIDPDMVFLRPLTTKVKGSANLLYTSGLKESDIFDTIGRGKSAGQQYGLGAPWANDRHPKFDRHHVCGDDSPCLEYSQNEAAKRFSVGPPYIVEKDDLHRLANSWTQFVPRVYEKYPYLLAEMYAYSMAAAHESLPHLQLDHYMVSNIDAGGEGWKWVDALENVCEPPVQGIYHPASPLPVLLHFCQFYRAGDISFQKRRLPHNSFSCDAPLLVEPPEDLGETSYMMKDGVKKNQGARQAKRNAFMICVLHRTINAALIDYKQHMCKAEDKPNYEKTLNLIKH